MLIPFVEKNEGVTQGYCAISKINSGQMSISFLLRNTKRPSLGSSEYGRTLDLKKLSAKTFFYFLIRKNIYENVGKYMVIQCFLLLVNIK